MIELEDFLPKSKWGGLNGLHKENARELQIGKYTKGKRYLQIFT